MSLSLEGLKAGLSYPNVLAFLRVIRERESGQGPDAYLMINGGGRMDGFQRHPWENVPTTQGARACGAYQFLGTTWGGLCRQYEFPDFSPESQDLGAIALIKERGALGDVIAGRIEQAIAKLRPVWTSLPGASESSASWTMSKAIAVYTGAGGTLDNAELLGQPATPAASPEPVTQPAEVSRMPIPLIVGVIGSLLSQLIPVVAPLFDKKTETPAKLSAATKVIDLLVTTTGSLNEQEAIQKLQSDPALVQKLTQTIVSDPAIMPMLEISSAGIDKAREDNVKLVQSADAWWKLVFNPVLIVTCLTLPLVYIIVWRITDFLAKVSGDVIAQTIGTVIGLVLGGIMGFWMGQTYQNMKAERTRATDQPQGAAK
jgi:muramidase (phage lysozyme)